MEVKYGGKLEIGDLIVVAQQNTHDVGWCAGVGIGTI
jgi:hypothetical protein